MLVLTRKLMEKLYIGEEICITVVRLEGGQVRLGIDAPRHIPVVRAELSPLPTAPRPAVEAKPPSSSTDAPGGRDQNRLRIRRGATRGIGSPPRAPSR
jgi:carbon storage regulator